MQGVSDALLALFLKNADTVGWWFDSDLDEIVWTDNAAHIFGLPQSEASDILSLFAEREQKAWQEAIQQVQHGRGSFDIELPCTRGKEKKTWRVKGSFSHKIPNLTVLGTAQDVTEIKRLHHDVERNHYRYRNVIESAMDAIISVDKNQLIVLFNREAERVFGWRAEEATGQHLNTLIPERYHGAHKVHVDDFLVENGAHRAMGRSMELWAVRKDGSEFPVEASLSKFKTDGDIISTVIVRDVSAKKAYEKKMYKMAFFDPLTGLPNRNALFDESPALFQRASFLELALIDLDRFKDINDSYGHYFGDKVLAEIGAQLKRVAEEHGARVYRLAGDEFVVISVGKDLRRLTCQLMKIGNVPLQIDNHACWPGMSIGIARSPGDASNVEDLIKCADVALNISKQKGRGRIEYFREDLFSAIEARTLLTTKLEESIRNGELYYCFQPIIDTDTARTVGYEALARWCHNGQQVPPEVFMTLAEESGRIHVIQDHLFDFLAANVAKLGEDNYLAINISPSQMVAESFYRSLQRFLTESGFAAARLELELTERSLLLVGDEVVVLLERIKALGVKLSIDDFGTGYSCLSYLKDLPFDKLKIDRSFVMNIDNDPKNLAIVMTIINLAKNLGMSVLAEGVEKEGQANVLKRMGCHLFQGYLYSKPLTLSQLAEAC